MENTLVPQILIVDNASTDNTLEIVSKNFRNVEIIKSEENLGFGKANNIGLKKVLEKEIDYAFLLNQDAWIDKNCITELVSIAAKNKEYGILSPFHFNWEGTKIDSYFLRMANPNDCPNFLNDTLMKAQNEVYDIKFIHAACWLITKNCLQKVGGFDPLFFHYGEDNDLAARVILKQLKIGICPRTSVYHLGAFDIEKPNDSKLRHLKEVETLLRLKRLDQTLGGNYFYFFKESFDKSTSLIFSRKIKSAFQNIRNTFYFLKFYSKIKSSRKDSKNPNAFL